MLLAISFLYFQQFTQSSYCLKHRPTKTNIHRLRLRVIRQRRLAQLPPNATLLIPAKRQLVVQQVVIVDPDCACAETIAHVDSRVEVAGVQGGGEAVGALVADADGVVHGLELGDGADGAEDLFLHDLHVF